MYSSTTKSGPNSIYFRPVLNFSVLQSSFLAKKSFVLDCRVLRLVLWPCRFWLRCFL
jgi:hypothetical protein